MKTLGNIIWFLFGGLWSGLLWYLAGIIAALSIIGLPWARACFLLGDFTLWPFGKELVDRRQLTGKDDVGTGTLGVIGNIIWFVVIGWTLAVAHLTAALACALTIIGIPFAVQHLKLAVASLCPIGKEVITRS
ncbi:MAG: YccF domain-containing protein [Verrucomicrobiota bacterium]